MKYKKFLLKNYKAIENVEVNLSRNVIPLIGVNESGKTSILHGILAFDKDKDHVIDGEHLLVKNKYLTNTKQKPCELVAGVLIEGLNEFEAIGNSIDLDMRSPVYGWLKGKVEKNESIDIIREYDPDNFNLLKQYELYDAPDEICSDKKAASLIKELTKRLPNILYFDDFSDRVPTEVVFSTPDSDRIPYSRGKDREWQEIVAEIFSRALEEEYSILDFIRQADEDERSNYLNDVNQTLNNEIVAEWKNLKVAFSSFSDDSSDLELKLVYERSGGKHVFKFKVIDSESGGNQRQFNVKERSKGFQWFFNFIMKLKFNPKYKQNPENAIYLLDEPGSYLHSSAQTELLKKLCSIGEKNSIVFCTHSQYLLDPDVINIAAIKIVSKDDGKIGLTDYGNSSHQRNLGAFSALRDALHLKIGFDGNQLKKCILTEGITDYYVYRMFCNLPNITIIPGAGCSHLKELISLLIAISDQFLVVLDNDGQGRNNYNKYNTFFGETFIKNCYKYEGIDKTKSDFVLEDLFSEEDRVMIEQEVSCGNIKDAFVLLYYCTDDVKNKIRESLSSESRRRLNVFNQNVAAHFKDD